MKLLASIALLLIIGCQTSCIDPPHQWRLWEDTGPCTHAGIQQKRYCQTCGIVQVKVNR